MSDFDKDDWLRDNQPDDGEEEDDLSFDWLQDADQNDAQQAGSAGRTGVTGELDWLRAMGDQDTSQAGEDEHAFDWESERPASGAAAPTGLTGMLDWQRQEDRFEQQLDDLESDAPDLFGGALFDDQGEAEETRKAATDHLEAMFSTPPPTESGEDDNDAFLAALGLDIEPTEEDFLNALGLTPPGGVQQEIPGTESFDDTFGDIFGDVTDPFAASAQQPQQAADDDLFGQFDQAAPQAADTFTFDEELFAPPETPGTPTGINTNFLREMGAVQGSEEAFDFDDPFAQQEDALSLGTDFLSSVGLTPSTQAAQQPTEGGADSSSEMDWFGQFEEEGAAPQSASPDWLADLGTDFDDTFGGTPAAQPELDEEPDFDALFSGTPAAAPTGRRKQADDVEEPDFDALFGGTPAGKAKSAASDDLGALRSEFDSLDDLLSSFDDIKLPETGELELDTSGDFDSMMEATRFDQPEPDRPAIELSPDAPEWLAGLAPSITDTGTSAAAVARQRKERPLDELDARLRHLREEGLNLPTTASQPSEALAGVLPGVKETLPPADLTAGAPGLVGAVELRPEQRQKAALLQALIGDEAAVQYTPRSAIDATYDSPNMDFLEDEFEDPFAELEGRAPAPARPRPTIAEPEIRPATIPERPTRRIRPRRPIARIGVSLLILAAVLLPFFVRSLQLGELPPAAFLPTSPAWSAYQTVGAVSSGDLVLVAVEYGPTGAAELDVATDALLRHILHGGGRPVLIGTNATGLLHAANLLDALAVDAEFLAQIGRDTSLQPNRDYYVLRYLTASAVGVRALGSNLAEVLATDVRGNATGLADRTLADFALIVIIAERSEELRIWMEQLIPLTSAPVVAAVGYSAAPLAQPYLNNSLNRGLIGLLVGYRDAYTYNALLDAGAPVLPDVLPTSTPEATVPAPTEEPTQSGEEAAATEAPTEQSGEQPIVTDEAVESPSPEAGQDVKTAVPEITKTPSDAGLDAEPSEAPELEPTVEAPTEAAATPTQESTPTQEATATPTISEFVRVATVNSDTNVNVRELPSTSAPVVAGLAPGQTVRVIGESPDFQWFNIWLPDGRQGWIAAFLVDIEDVPADEAPPLPPTPVGKRFEDAPRSAKPLAQDTTPTPEGFGDPVQLMTDAAATVTAAGVSIDDAFATATAFAAQPGFSLEDAAATATALAVQPGFSIEDAAATATALNISPDDAFATATALNLSADDVFATATALGISPGDAFATATVSFAPVNPIGTDNRFLNRASAADTGLHEERWYAMTLGLVVIVGIIGLSSAVHILRGLRRRGK